MQEKNFVETTEKWAKEHPRETFGAVLQKDRATLFLPHVEIPREGDAMLVHTKNKQHPKVIYSLNGELIGERADIILNTHNSNKLAVRIGQREWYLDDNSSLEPMESFMFYFEGKAQSFLITASKFDFWDENGIFYFIAVGDIMMGRLRQCFINNASLVASEEILDFFATKSGLKAGFPEIDEI